jgi:hypothetical protein
LNYRQEDGDLLIITGRYVKKKLPPPFSLTPINTARISNGSQQSQFSGSNLKDKNTIVKMIAQVSAHWQVKVCR